MNNFDHIFQEITLLISPPMAAAGLLGPDLVIVIGPAVDQKLSKGVCLRPKGPGPNCAVDVVSIYAQEVYVDSPVVKHSTSKGELIIQRRFIHSLVILGNPRNYLFYYLLSNVLVSHRPKGRLQTSEKSESNST